VKEIDKFSGAKFLRKLPRAKYLRKLSSAKYLRKLSGAKIFTPIQIDRNWLQVSFEQRNLKYFFLLLGAE
jgi:hypothetical protein